ncbi:Transcriptional repressor SdpR [Mycolicibacterium vanbaalenii]|uniref:Transcriptional repressor SdpR n=1 Tax=Mycolicibacterium vanbaalenii TaxID=110539 RepID=A0A5S9QN75_MYCVN|nr:metalloregulator ArsR/SmtB family transcription factor [Mycolicibacterium vanbaalenii]CAA0119860.1 Transcriptional repressor SdpR [Mycolicibacterium vanbaalenii]
MQATVFEALGEPSRLRIVELLRAGPQSVGDIAETLGIRQPQVSKHLRVLNESGIVAGEARARRRIYHLEVAPFEEIGRWAESFERLWEIRLDSLGRYLDSVTREGTLDEPEEDR